jgi:membrane-associated phospholipid phosphatase
MIAKHAGIFLTVTGSALGLGAACVVVQGPLPGDVMVTRGLQAIFGLEPSWADWLTQTAKPPLVLATGLFAAGLAWWVAGKRRALAVPLAFGFAWILDISLRAMMMVPRPSSTLVAVASPSGSSGLPSTFGLVYGSLFGAVIVMAAGRMSARVARVVAFALILAGSTARVVLGGHWPSQILASVLLGLVTAWIACEAIEGCFRLKRRSSAF